MYRFAKQMNSKASRQMRARVQALAGADGEEDAHTESRAGRGMVRVHFARKYAANHKQAIVCIGVIDMLISDTKRWRTVQASL